MPTLKELKALIKGHSDKPKLSAGKETLLLYAEKVGLLKPKEVKEAREEIKVEREMPAKKSVKMAAVDEFPELKKPVAKAPVKVVEKPAAKSKAAPKQVVETAAPEPKRGGGFAAFISANKGQGHNMKDLAIMYRAQKDE
jgi:DNA-directed RNA polymerase subunit F